MIFLTIDIVKAIHEESLAQYGGASGLRDEGLLESALARPQTRLSYDDPKPDIWDLAATYCHGIVKNHPFVDGNKRTGITATAVFLGVNGHELVVDEAQGVLMVRGLADGSVGVTELANWLKNSVL